MNPIELIPTEIDDPKFISLTNSFISHFAVQRDPPIVRAIHIDNWFGQRWLGFAGKLKGIAGIRNRKLYTALPVPPFRPSRVVSAYSFKPNEDGSYLRRQGRFNLHAEKNGGIIWHLHVCGLYCWYSGNSLSNTKGCLMIYEVTEYGNDAWYIMFDRMKNWNLSRCVNIPTSECSQIIDAHHEDISNQRSLQSRVSAG